MKKRSRSVLITCAVGSVVFLGASTKRGVGSTLHVSAIRHVRTGTTTPFVPIFTGVVKYMQKTLV